jgi:hypothetical protein
MYKIPRLPFLLVVLLILLSLACQFPFVSSPTPIVFPTPDLTMTALFNPTVTSPPVGFPTFTPPPSQVGLTPTQILPQPTMIPSNTATPLPPIPSPTKTPTATISSAGPGMRPKFGMVGYFFSTPPTIDGSLEDWTLERYRIESVVYGKSNHSGIEDLSGRAMIGWDEKNLFLGIRVIDDKYVQKASGEILFKGDSLDILLDTDVSSDFYFGALNSDDFQLGISAGLPAPNKEVEAYLWYPKSIEGSRDGVKIASRSSGDGYIVEAAIPWSLFSVSPFKGQHLGFAFSISDNDNPNENIQQSMVSFVPTRILTDPTTWGDLTLIKP